MKRVPLALTCMTTLLAVFACANQRDAQPVESSAVTAQAVEAPVVPPPADPTPDDVRATVPTDFVKAPVLASNAPAPASQPALPKGHPDIAALMAEKQQQPAPQAEQQPALPSGHPDISKMQAPTAAAPPADGAAPQLPKGHPDISQMTRTPTSQPAAMIGTLAVRAVQCTKDGPAIGSAPVVVELYQNDKLIDKREGKLDEHGAAKFDGIPVGLVVQPVVRVTYKGVDFQSVGNVLDSTHSQQHVQVGLYESTETAPAWKIEMQHLMLQPSADGLGVMEMLVIDNPTDRVFIGQPPAKGAAPDAKREVLTFVLPQGATNVQLVGGLDDCCTKIENGKVTSAIPLMPGQSQFRIDYTLPVKDGKAEFALSTPAAIGHLMAFVPDDGTTVTSEGVESSGLADMGSGKVRLFKAANVPTGQLIKLNISGITATTAAPVSHTHAGASAATGTSGQLAKVVAGVGGLVIFLVGGMFLLIKSPKRAKA